MASDRQLKPTARRRFLGASALLAGALTPSLSIAQTAPAITSSANDKGGPPPALGSLLALPSLTLLDGRRFDSARADGKVLVLYWWASWCPFCAIQSPHMEKLWQAQRDRGLLMLALSIDRRIEEAAAYLTRRGYSFPAALVTPDSARVLPKPKGLPVTVVRGRDGRVLMAEAGQIFPEDIEQIARWV